MKVIKKIVCSYGRRARGIGVEGEKVKSLIRVVEGFRVDALSGPTWESRVKVQVHYARMWLYVS